MIARTHTNTALILQSKSRARKFSLKINRLSAQCRARRQDLPGNGRQPGTISRARAWQAGAQGIGL